MLALQAQGGHNIEWVTATPVLPQVVEAWWLAVQQGLRRPVVHNSSAYERVSVLSLLQGVVDIYLPDLKYGSPEPARRWSRAPDYVERSQAAVREMARQVGPLQVDEKGLATRGLLVRHLVLPADQGGTDAVLGFLAQRLPPHTPVSLMAQYRPPPGLAVPAPLDRPLRAEEYDVAQAALVRWDIEHGFVQSPDSVEAYVPDFSDPAHPFER
jgi:putative pyruvate formate lyase activating enzyme